MKLEYEMNEEEKIEVVFLKESDGSIFAVFNENYNSEIYKDIVKWSYSSIGQHGACHIDYISECEVASPVEYESLKKELESLGYNLEIIDIII